MPETLKGWIERITYHNPENGFAVLRVKVASRHDLVSVVGNVTSVTPGEHLEATGRWIVDRQHGQQFKADAIQTAHPASAAGIQRYLASGAIRSVGPKLAERIVAVYQEDTLDIFDKSPDMLLAVKGIGKERLKRIRQSWVEQKSIRKLMLFLTEYGITSMRAVRIYRAYGQQAIARIKENPYQLAEDIRGIGFKTADELAGRLGIDRNSPYRAQAAIRFALSELAGEGHCGYVEHGVIEHARQLIDVERAIIEEAARQVLKTERVVRELIDGEPWLFLSALHAAELGLAASVSRLVQDGSHPLPAIDVDAAVDWVEQKLGIQLGAGQQEALRQACRKKLLVITGGPGVGKTTLVRSILEIFQAKRLKCVLAAPTGRAAKRLAETTGRKAQTVHRLLEVDPLSGQFKRNADRPLSGDLFVLDETSMVDAVLGHHLLRAIPDHACLILVGDVDQLPSVGPGRVLADLIASQSVPVVRLTEIFRQARESRIVNAACEMNQGRLPNLDASDELTDFYFIESKDPESIQETLLRLIRERIPARFGLDPRRDIQILTPMNRGELGARHLNQLMQAAMNPSDGGSEVERFGWTYRVGDRVIQTENNYDRDVFNGDLGAIQQIDRVEQQLVVDFEGRSVSYHFNELDELSLAYVLTIHKSQGSEFPCVLLPLHTQHYVMLQRNLLYTAVTRGRQLVIVVGTRKAMSLAVRRADTSVRCTTLQHRLRSDRLT